MERITLSIKELQQAGVPKWCAKMTAESLVSLYKRKDGKSPYYYVKFDVPEPLQEQLGTALKRESTKQTDKRLARTEALRLVANWCKPLLEPVPSASVSPEPERESDGESLEPHLRRVALSHELIDELCRARRDATMWSAEDDANGVSFEGERSMSESEFASALSKSKVAQDKLVEALTERSSGKLPPEGELMMDKLSDHYAFWEPRYNSVIESGRRSSDFDEVADEAVDFAAILGYSISAEDPAFVAFVRSFAISERRAFKAIQVHRLGEPSEAEGFAGVPAAAGSHKLSYLLEQWQSNRSRHLKPATVDLYSARFNVFVEHVHNVPSRIVTRTHVTRFLEDSVYGGTLTEKTANAGYLPALRAVFGYARAVGFIDIDPTVGISKPKLSKSEQAAQEKKRKPFSTEQLNALFASVWYAGDASDIGRSQVVVGNARYWVPLLQLFQNLRPEEACQLEMSDAAVIDGTHAIRVEEVIELEENDNGRHPLVRRKSVKSTASQRWAPVHQRLLELGWAEFVAARYAEAAAARSGDKTTTWLFPELPRGKNNSDAFGKRFNDFLHNRLKLDVVQYSLRHAWEDERRRAQALASQTGGAWPEGMYFAIAGRAHAGEEEGSGGEYGEGYGLDDKKFFLDQLQFKGVVWPILWPEWVKQYGPLRA